MLIRIPKRRKPTPPPEVSQKIIVEAGSSGSPEGTEASVGHDGLPDAAPAPGTEPPEESVASTAPVVNGDFTLSRKDAAAYLTGQGRYATCGSLAALAFRNVGPKWIRSGRRVLYSRSSLDSWLTSANFSAQE